MDESGRPSNKLEDINNKLKYSRKLIGYTLKNVSELIGCSESLLSKIERGNVKPTLPMLYKLAEIYGVTVASLFSDNDKGSIAIYNSGERPELNLGSKSGNASAVVFERIIPYKEGRLLDANLHVIPVNGGSSGTYSHSGEEVGFVIEGYVELVVDGQSYLLSAGSSFYFSSELPHSYRNIGSSSAKILWVASLRQSSNSSLS